MLRSGPADTLGAVFPPAPPNTTRSSGAPAAEPSTASATRLPEPLITKAIALPETQPPRFTTCWTSADRSGVRCAAPASPTVLQAGGLQATEALVRGRAPTLFVPVVKGTALSEASPWTASVVVTLLVSSVWNWIHADWIDAP